MENRVGKFYPVQGTNKFQTTSFPITKAVMLDVGAQAVGTATTFTLPKGSLVLGFAARVTEAVTSAGSATLQLGFTGTAQLSAAVAKATLVQDYVFGASTNTPVLLADDDTFDSKVATAALTAGKVEIFVTYIPIPSDSLNSDEFREFVTA